MINKSLFGTKEKVSLAISNFKTLKAHAGWQLLTELLQHDIDRLQKQILDGVEGASVGEMNLKRESLRHYKEVIGIPDFYIKELEQPEPFVDEDDPYHTVKSLKKARQDSR